MKSKITYYFTIVFILTWSITIKAQIPQAINFQAIARDANGDPMVNTPIQIQLSVLDGSATGSVVYKELRALTTNAYGSFSFQIGVNPYSVLVGSMTNIDWKNGNKFLKIDYDPTNQLQFNLTLGTIQFVTVPYAFAAGSVYKIDLSKSNPTNGDVLKYNSATGNFEPSTANADWTGITNKPLFATIATSGSYNDLSNKPSLFDGTWTSLTGKPTLFDGTWVSLTGKPTLATVATSGSYNDLSNKPDFTNYVTLNGNQTITGNKTFNGTVSVAPPVNNSDAASKVYVDSLRKYVNAVIDNLLQAGVYQLTDIDGNSYKTKKIGTQIWMTENLRTTTYNDGTPIPNVTDVATWPSLTTGAYRWWNNDAIQYKYTYGALYNYFAVVSPHNLCPVGWHVPTNNEFLTLINAFGGSAYAGGKLKEAGLAHWMTPNTGADNASGFTALPSYSVPIQGQFWSSTPSDGTNTYLMQLTYATQTVQNLPWTNTSGNNVRCIKDN